ncbi:1-(5-phosphoribosyl)-5-[(5-phosphoribosylamino)methylideneamino] imidazole-4-carboxamide isomerase [Commensalibacter sp. Nvir]|uniref:1-(5-phosphoribosyl)-5-[(5- phosphoribosylamino)methylideneamino]imidazole-4- carboxamide isomerase n=1 Tax=Commensalibacter sp. Nvir TaxID=3069817 RepID=UPI002D37F49C|nr:1-(5-phosphoribosyl)-5-[(5-phosphoribosylamino)methylideneamino] imidazole-4-carboxamide isomerase [Commensalibacter sp. Nvir]
MMPTPTLHPLTLYPAIDLKGGQCVRLQQGVMERATVYSDDPGTQAKTWQNLGFKWLHVVDLNGAFAQKPININAVQNIVNHTTLPIQLGGGIRDLDTIEFWLTRGITRIILGSVAVYNPQLVYEACKTFPGQVVIGIDAKLGYVSTEGWAKTSEMKALDLAKRLEDSGAAAIIFTEINQDGMLSGLDLDQTAQLAHHLSIPIIASGGVGHMDHLRTLRKIANQEPGIEGVVIGRALYDGRIQVKEALEILEKC